MRKLIAATTGLFFAMFWASASVAGKFGLQSVEPLVLFNIRFLVAGTVLLVFVMITGEHVKPEKDQWKPLIIFALFNTTLYLGIFVLALQWITPGITTLAVALNPLLISIFSAYWLRRRVKNIEWLSLLLGLAGIVIASYPQLKLQDASMIGLLLLIVSMTAYSLGSVYYASVQWKLTRLSINGWQALLGGVMLIPFTLLLHKNPNHFDQRFWASLLWLVFPVSILAIQLWLRLLKTDAVRASLWLYLCPLFGFVYAHWFFDEPITVHTVGGTAMVLLALYLGQKKTA